MQAGNEAVAEARKAGILRHGLEVALAPTRQQPEGASGPVALIGRVLPTGDQLHFCGTRNGPLRKRWAVPDSSSGAEIGNLWLDGIRWRHVSAQSCVQRWTA